MATEQWAYRLPRQAERAQTRARAARGARVVIRASTAAFLTLAFVAVMAVFVPSLFGYKMMAVTGGSMSPTIRVGDAVYVREVGDEASSVTVGDVVTYRDARKGGMTTHRVVSVKWIDGDVYLQTKGDANPEPDVDLTPGADIYGVVGMRVPAAGPALTFATGRWGKPVLLGFPALVLMISEIGRMARRRRSRALAERPPVGATAPRTGPADTEPTPVAPPPPSAERPTSGPRQPALAPR